MSGHLILHCPCVMRKSHYQIGQKASIYNLYLYLSFLKFMGFWCCSSFEISGQLGMIFLLRGDIGTEIMHTDFQVSSAFACMFSMHVKIAILVILLIFILYRLAQTVK